MLYYLFTYLEELGFPGAGVFQYISFRASITIISSLLIYVIFGKKLIRFLQHRQIGEEVRDLGLQGQVEKKGTPTMGGLLIIISIVVPTLLFSKLDNVYIILMLITTTILGAVGFLDDYIKVFKKNKEGLSGRFKIIGQVLVGVIVASVLFFSDEVRVKQKMINENGDIEWLEAKKTVTTIPFLKSNEFDYSSITRLFGDAVSDHITWLFFIIVVVMIVAAVSNGANLTDGLDGLATGVSAIIGVTLAVFAYVSGNFVFADYLNIMYIPNSGELTIFILAFVGACVGFLWYNSFPAQIFMGDTGSLTLGGIIAVFAISVRKELLIPLLCGVFLVENLSVIIQVGYFKYTKKKYGEGRRLFLMSPIHHHYQKKNIHEAKIVSRFWIVGICLAVLTFITLKLR